ncbi:alpha/beta hydrolase [Nocardioides sp. SLBN-35]|uniref:alpha/beta hydrolase n=1 Tax=Nocardioides sp. SLBN-35 TaxID=2768445 RepID=UPI0011509DFE|nr:alpha/beta hydrolase [Nocardioides sp. SLBN-35]
MEEIAPSGWNRHEVLRDGARVVGWTWGGGAPVVLLHGYPQTSYMWRLVVPHLVAAGRSVVAVDLRGYGASGPAHGDGPVDPGRYAKREMAADVLALLDALDHRDTALDVVGHDRGARVAHRMAVDHPSRVRTITVLDIVPTLHMFEHVDREMAEAYFHWFFLARPGGLPEALISADPEAWLRSRFEGRHSVRPAEPGAVDVYLDAFRRPGVIAATCADYRAAATVDLVHDRADRAAGRRVTAPLLAGWGRSSYVGRNFEVTDVWAQHADRVTGLALEADHYVAEEAPAELAEALLNHWTAAR